jgi:hypothetical protein
MKNIPQTTKRKCNYERVQVTLDMCHNKQCTSFADNEQKKQQYEKELDKIQEKINNYESRPFSSFKDEEFEQYHALFDKRKQKKELIKELENTSEIDYLTKTGGILFEYYDLVEKQNVNKKNSVCNILDFFGNTNVTKKITSSTDNNSSVNIDYTKDREKLMEEYLSQTDSNYIDNDITSEIERCQYCDSTDMNILLHEGLMYCNECNTTEYIISDNDKPSYKEPPKEISYFSYKRINHFNEFALIWLYFYFNKILNYFNKILNYFI